MNHWKKRISLKLLPTAAILLLSLCSYGQKKHTPPKVPVPEPPRIVKVDNGLSGTQWRLVIDTSGDRTILRFYRLTKTAIATAIVHFTDDSKFRLNVMKKGCAFKTEGTYEINLPESSTSDEVLVLAPPSNLYFMRYHNLAPCAERLKTKIANSYTITDFQDDSFTMEEQDSPMIAVPAQ